MYTNYAAIRRWTEHDNEMQSSASAQAIATLVKLNGGRVTMEQLRSKFYAHHIADAIEKHRTIHPVQVETRQGVATFYEAN